MATRLKVAAMVWFFGTFFIIPTFGVVILALLASVDWGGANRGLASNDEMTLLSLIAIGPLAGALGGTFIPVTLHPVEAGLAIGALSFGLFFVAGVVG